MLSSKILNNLAAMSGAFLLGERPKYSAEAMAELWRQVDAVHKEADAAQKEEAERIAKEEVEPPAAPGKRKR